MNQKNSKIPCEFTKIKDRPVDRNIYKPFKVTMCWVCNKHRSHNSKIKNTALNNSI